MGRIPEPITTSGPEGTLMEMSWPITSGGEVPLVAAVSLDREKHSSKEGREGEEALVAVETGSPTKMRGRRACPALILHVMVSTSLHAN